MNFEQVYRHHDFEMVTASTLAFIVHQSMRVPHSIQIQFRIIRRVVRLLFHRLHKHLLPPAILV